MAEHSTPQIASLEKLQTLRVELKEWEKAFTADHEGRKAGRDDIKKDAVIASKYKEYTNLRKLASGRGLKQREWSPSQGFSKKNDEKKEQQENRKRKANCDDDDDNTVQGTTIQTPKRARPATTPLKFVHSAEVDPYHSPSIVRSLQFTPSHLRAVGPTPQRDGKVLGIFDLLDDEDDDHHVREGERFRGKTTMTRKGRQIFADHPDNQQQQRQQQQQQRTPSKPDVVPDINVTPVRYGRTPASSGRRFFLDMFVTPSKRKLDRADDDDQGGGGSTPAFLRQDGRRRQALQYDENGEPKVDSPILVGPLRMSMRRPLGKGLSSLIADLRKLENDKFDEDLDLLRGMEQPEGSGGVAVTVKRIKLDDTAANHENHTSEPSRAKTAAALGHENVANGVESSREPLEERGEHQDRQQQQQPSQPRKIWKKRGQKRTTKRVIIRPSRVKPRVPSHLIHQGDDDDDDDDDDGDNGNDDACGVVGQGVGRSAITTITDDQIGNHSPDHDKVNDDPDSRTTAIVKSTKMNKKQKPNTKSKQIRKNDDDDDGDDDDGEIDGQTKTIPTKNTAKPKSKGPNIAHANFRKLKLRNQSSKGGSRRFGGGRRNPRR